MFESTEFESLFKRFRNQKVLIIGDVMIDTYLWGSVGRVSPEAPVPIVSGVIEENLADLVINQDISLPIVAFVAGRFVDEMPGIRFGHAATIVEGDRGTTKGKIACFRKAGIRVAESFSDIIPLIKEVI